jgi:hypothetical protein
MKGTVRDIMREYNFQREGDLERVPLGFMAADIENIFIVNLGERMSFRKNLEGGRDGREK